MAKPFDPRTMLKQINNSILCRFFAECGGLEGVDWNNLAEHEVEPLFQGWQRLMDCDRQYSQAVFQDVNELADERELTVLAEEISSQFPECSEEFSQIKGRFDRILWAFIIAYDAFKRAALFASRPLSNSSN